MCTGGGIHYRGCTFITGGGGIHQCCIHYRGCTFITGGWHPPVLHPLQGGVPSLLGGVHTRTYVYWGWHLLQGVYLHNWGGRIHQCCIHYRGCTFITGGGVWHPPVLHPLQGVYLHNWGGGIHQCCIYYRGCTFITGGVASTSAASTTGGVPSLLGVCIPGRMCTGGGIHYRGCTFIIWGWHPPVLHPLQGMYLHNWGGGIHQCCIHYRGVYLHCWGCAYQDACVLGVASTTGGVPS